MGLGSSRVVGSICDRRQAVSCARFCFITAEAGRAACIRWAVIGELLGPHAPRALLELSYPRSRARRVLKANGKPPASRGAPRRTRVEIRSGWDYASVGHLVFLVQTCVKGPLCYVMLCNRGSDRWRPLRESLESMGCPPDFADAAVRLVTPRSCNGVKQRTHRVGLQVEPRTKRPGAELSFVCGTPRRGAAAYGVSVWPVQPR